MIICFELFAVMIGRKVFCRFMNLRLWNQIQYLGEDRLSDKKTTFAHAILVCVVTTKIAGGRFLTNFPLIFPGQHWSVIGDQWSVIGGSGNFNTSTNQHHHINTLTPPYTARTAWIFSNPTWLRRYYYSGCDERVSAIAYRLLLEDEIHRQHQKNKTDEMV